MYFAYIMRCADGTLYTGYTDDIARREAVHNSGRGAKYTRSRLPVKMVYHESFATRSEAMNQSARAALRVTSPRSSAGASQWK